MWKTSVRLLNCSFWLCNNLSLQCCVLSPNAKKCKPARNVPTVDIWSYLHSLCVERNRDWIPCRGESVSSSNRPDWLWDPHGPLLKGHRPSSPGVKRPDREADNLPLSIAELKNAWICISTLPVCFRGVHKDNFSFFDALSEIVKSLKWNDVTQGFSLI
jgi:hypothetical protein